MSERLRRSQSRAEEMLAETIRRVHESGEIRHLHGQPLNLDDDPDAAVARALKQQGFSHPAIEAARELDEPRRAANAVLARLRRRRAWLADPRSRCTPTQAHAFNQSRERALEEYREKLLTLNAAIRDYNLGAPEALHQRPVLVDRALRIASEEIPALALDNATPPPDDTRRDRRFWRRRQA